MIRIATVLCRTWLWIVLLAASSFAAAQTTNPVFEATSSGLFTFAGEDRAIRVTAVFVEQASTVVETTVVFVDAQGAVLKQVRGNLVHGQPVVVELTRQDVGPSVLVRVVVVHKLPGMREAGYPILVTMQPIAMDGHGRSPTTWDVGRCGANCGSPVGRGQHASCTPIFPDTF